MLAQARALGMGQELLPPHGCSGMELTASPFPLHAHRVGVCWGSRVAEGPPKSPSCCRQPSALLAGYFFLPRSLLSSLSAEMAMPGCSELTIIAAV